MLPPPQQTCSLRQQSLAANKELINHHHHQQQGAVAPDAALHASQLPEDQSGIFSNLRYRFDPRMYATILIL